MDVEFTDKLPEIYSALNVEYELPLLGKTKLVLEVQQHLGDSWVRAVAMSTTDGLKRGMEIIRGARKADGRDVWEGGKILDPDNGSEYTLRLTPVDGGKKLEVRGSIAFFGRTQTWVRVQ